MNQKLVEFTLISGQFVGAVLMAVDFFLPKHRLKIINADYKKRLKKELLEIDAHMNGYKRTAIKEFFLLILACLSIFILCKCFETYMGVVDTLYVPKIVKAIAALIYILTIIYLFFMQVGKKATIHYGAFIAIVEKKLFSFYLRCPKGVLAAIGFSTMVTTFFLQYYYTLSKS